MKKIAWMTGVALTTVLLSACGGGTKAPGGGTGGGNTGGDIPVASKAPEIRGTSIESSNGQGTISTYTDVIAKCTFKYTGSINQTIVATRTEGSQTFPGFPYKHSGPVPSTISGNLVIEATCTNSAGTATRRVLN